MGLKIGQEIRSQLDPSQKNPPLKSVQGNNFHSAIRTEQQQMRETELKRLLEQITAQGDKVARFRSFKDLSKFKGLVKQFVKEAVQYGLDLKQTRNFSMNGQSRKLTTVDTIDEKLVELTDSVFDQEKKSMDILEQIGEIKGLLVNLYT
ncbi:YaaR family protein [Virgibacillus sp. MSP4-1]|uniref:YaaR family protein n=1 Tax=Virgibacillus sp. MSP4-1 TaxID=2700081 RepID=UPI001EE4B5A3|nr:YaaR family protein [Virgibacillus sp. MSP4-1]